MAEKIKLFSLTILLLSKFAQFGYTIVNITLSDWRNILKIKKHQILLQIYLIFSCLVCNDASSVLKIAVQTSLFETSTCYKGTIITCWKVVPYTLILDTLYFRELLRIPYYRYHSRILCVSTANIWRADIKPFTILRRLCSTENSFFHNLGRL